RHRPEVRDDRERLERGLGEPLLGRPVEEPRARVGGRLGGTEREPAGHVLEHDPARSFREPLPQDLQRVADLLGVRVAYNLQILERERLRGDDEQRLDRARELGGAGGLGGDQAERTVHERLLSASGREILIGANGAACAMASSFCLRSSSGARKATAISTRDIPSTSWSKSKRDRRRSSDRQRSRNCETGGKRSAMCASDGAGGGTASTRSAAASFSGSCGASRRSGFGASGAGPTRKCRWRRSSSRSRRKPAASFARRYSASRRASSSAASSGSSSDSSASSSGNIARAFNSSSAPIRIRN